MQGNFYNNQYHNLEQYVVMPNDSLYMIAKKFNISVEELKSVNHLVSNMIYPNQVLFIPRKKHNNVCYPGINIIENFKNKCDISCDDNYSYVVMAGDTIEDILAKFGLSPIEFLKLNEKNILKVGQKIIIRR